ncbi:MAG: Trk system potassium transporter TrkA [Gammaproteobacteria bacterium]|nr:Trk system potassium transporter TrkA [Gammaproteobacteria bacterium]
MKIIILGAGQVGTSLANSLSSEANDITVVDVDGVRLNLLQDRLDLRTVVGRGSHPEVLRRAGIEDADMLIAVTNSDETNMVACQIAYTLFHTPRKIARIRSQRYLTEPEIFGNHAIPIDMMISPEQLVTDYIRHLIEYPGALQVLDFANGRVRLIVLMAFHGGPLVGHKLKTLAERLPNIKARVVAIYRNNRSILPQGETFIDAGDEVFILAADEDIRKVMLELRRLDQDAHRIIISGGGNIGKRLALSLEKRFQVKIIESNQSRAVTLSEDLGKATVLLGNGCDEELLAEENISSTDIFCALTNYDETNFLSAMLAKKMGAKKVLALINRTAYVDLVESSSVDIAISPEQITLSSLLTHVRRGDVVNVHSLRRGAAEAIEAVAHGDKQTSRVIGRTVENIPLPKGANIGAIVRGDEVIVPHHDTEIAAEDHLIIFLVDKSGISEVERLFSVGIAFL